ncbi:MAG: hypothetical protein ACRDIU_07040 [Actinomycetota bacterium]
MRPYIHRAGAGLLLALFAISPSVDAAPQPAAASAAGLALDWLGERQFPAGGFGGDPADPRGGPDPGATADVVFAIAAGGKDPAAWLEASGEGPLDYLETESERYDCDEVDRSDCNAGRAAKIALAVSVAGRDPRNFGGNDLLGGLTFGGGPAAVTANSFSMGFALLAWAAAGEAVPAELITRALGTQKEDGGWTGFSGGSDTNGTFMIAQGLVAARPSAGVQQPMIDGALPRAVEYLAGQQNPDGGFAYTKESEAFCGGPCPSEATSTAGVIQALRALGQDPGAGRWLRDGSAPVDALLRFRHEGGGFFYTGQSPDTVTTAGAVQGLMERSLVCLARLGACPSEPAPQSPPAAFEPPASEGATRTPAGDTAQPPPDGPAAPAAHQQPGPQAAGEALNPAVPPVSLPKAATTAAADPLNLQGPAAPAAHAEPGNTPMGLFPGGGGFAAPEAGLFLPPQGTGSPAPADLQSSPRAAAQPAYFFGAVIVFGLMSASCFIPRSDEPCEAAPSLG